MRPERRSRRTTTPTISERCWMVFTTGGVIRSRLRMGAVLISAPPARNRAQACVSITGRVAPEPEFLELRRLGGNFLSSGNVRRGGVPGSIAARGCRPRSPSGRGRNLRRVIRHGAEAVGHHVEEISQGRLAQALDVIRRRLARETTRTESRRCRRRCGSGRERSKC